MVDHRRPPKASSGDREFGNARLELSTPEREDSWVKDFIARLAGVIRSNSGKS
jgi:hypothetical protein